MRALSKNPANRYQSAEEFSEDLGRVISGQEVEATPLLPASEATQVISRPQSTAVLPPQVEAKGSGRKVWLGILIGILIVAVLGGGGYLLVNSLTKDENPQSLLIEVPNVVNMQFDAAKAQLEGLGLTVGDPKYRQTDSVPEGTVLAQDQPPHSQLAKGALIVLTVAKKPTTVAVPDLTGKTLAEAQAALEAVGLKIGTPSQASDPTVPAGHVVSSNPPAGTLAQKGSFVDVVVSTGPKLVAVPDVTTGCLSLGAAKKAISDAGLVAVIGPPAPPNPACVNANRIVAQDPAPGTMVPEGSDVTISQGTGSSPTP
jgi:serine/threonine-protein kinase